MKLKPVAERRHYVYTLVSTILYLLMVLSPVRLIRRAGGLYALLGGQLAGTSSALEGGMAQGTDEAVSILGNLFAYAGEVLGMAAIVVICILTVLYFAYLIKPFISSAICLTLLLTAKGRMGRIRKTLLFDALIGLLFTLGLVAALVIGRVAGVVSVFSLVRRMVMLAALTVLHSCKLVRFARLKAACVPHCETEETAI